MYDFSRLHFEFAGKHNSLNTPGFEEAYKYLRLRGIAVEDIDKLGIVIAPAREVISRARGMDGFTDDPRLAIVFPHIEGAGKPIAWWSSRLVESSVMPVATGFAAMVEARRWGKMFCPPAEAPHAYLVPTLDWSKLGRGDKVYIHESCIKAIAGARLGRWSVGLNGVRGWSARKHGIALVEELRGLPWKALGLVPVIVFDSNAEDNWDVQHAIGSLAAKLHEITGQRARHLTLPRKESGEHWGFDDYVVALGDEAGWEYLDRAGEAAEIELSDVELKKLELNTEVCFVEDISKVLVQETGVLLSVSSFHVANYVDRIAVVEDKPVAISQVWMRDPRKTRVKRLSYEPGGERMVAGEYFNLWKGMGVEPVGSEAGPWLELLERQVTDYELRRWIIQWFAYPLQNLGEKTNSFIHLYGPPGTGKNALLAPILQIYGVNGLVAGKDQLDAAFNSIYAARQFVNFDELHKGTKTAINRIKMLVTGETIVVNPKGEKEYELKNHAQVVTTSNYLNSISLDEGDRRACVVQFGERAGQEIWDRYFRWIDGGGAGGLYGYLLGVNLEGFNAKAQAPWTEQKGDVIEAARDAMEQWCHELYADPDSVLPHILRGAKVLTPEQIAIAYVGQDGGQRDTPSLRKQLGHRMKELRFPKVDQLSVGGRNTVVWIIREKERVWGLDEIRAAIKGKF